MTTFERANNCLNCEYCTTDVPGGWPGDPGLWCLKHEIFFNEDNDAQQPYPESIEWFKDEWFSCSYHRCSDFKLEAASDEQI